MLRAWILALAVLLSTCSAPRAIVNPTEQATSFPDRLVGESTASASIIPAFCKARNG